jgi:hypothetical protein
VAPLVPAVYALAAHPVTRFVLAAEEPHKTKGVRAVFGVVLMFMMLCGGVWLLLQSSFGPLQGYLITGTAFFGCWFVLSILWFTGVPGLDLGPLHIPRSTPQFLGPQGSEAAFVPLTGAVKAKHPLPEDKLADAPDPGDLTDQKAASDITAAQTAAQPEIIAYYAKKLNVGAESIQIPGTVKFNSTSIVNDNGIRWVRVSAGAAKALATDGQDVKSLIAKVAAAGPVSFDLYKEAGTKGVQTEYFVPIFLVLFLLHAVGLGFYEVSHRPTPQGAPEPERVAAGV